MMLFGSSRTYVYVRVYAFAMIFFIAHCLMNCSIDLMNINLACASADVQQRLITMK